MGDSAPTGDPGRRHPAGGDDFFMSWAQCAQLCKGPQRPDVTRVCFDWGPDSHVLRRFLGASALPNLREINILIASFSSVPLQLFKELRAIGRPIQTLNLITHAGISGTRWVQFIISTSADGIQVHVTRLTDDVREDDVSTLADGFRLTPFLLPERRE